MTVTVYVEARGGQTECRRDLGDFGGQTAELVMAPNVVVVMVGAVTGLPFWSTVSRLSVPGTGDVDSIRPRRRWSSRGGTVSVAAGAVTPSVFARSVSPVFTALGACAEHDRRADAEAVVPADATGEPVKAMKPVRSRQEAADPPGTRWTRGRRGGRQINLPGTSQLRLNMKPPSYNQFPLVQFPGSIHSTPGSNRSSLRPESGYRGTLQE